MALLEVCVDNALSLSCCISADVKRVELCCALELGGLTPSSGLVKQATNSPLSVHVLIRPRSGNFCYNDNEIAIMCDDIASAVDAGADGVVLGVANSNNKLQPTALKQMCAAAGSLNKTLHRVIDTLDNPLEGLEQAIDLGFNTILTSGGQPCVADGMTLLTALNHQANGRIDIMAGAGLTPTMVMPIHEQTGIVSFHSSCRAPHAEGNSLASQREKEPLIPQPLDNTLVSLGLSSGATSNTDVDVINRYHSTIATLSNQL